MPKYPAEFQNAYDKFLVSQVKYNRGDIEYPEFEAAYNELEKEAHKIGLNIAMYDEATQRRPQYKEGDNSNRTNFTYGPANKKWQTMHRVLKPAIIVIINKMHKWVLTNWDKDAYVYDDPRMQVLDESAHGFIDKYFDNANRKLDFMHKGVDVCMFILKEDIFYSSRIFLMLNNMPFFVLKQEEQENIDTFTCGIEQVCGFTNETVMYNDSSVDGGV